MPRESLGTPPYRPTTSEPWPMSTRRRKARITTRNARHLGETLVARSLDTPEDRFTLAMLYTRDGDWSKAREQYQVLLDRVETTKDPVVVNRLPDYLAAFILELIRGYQANKDPQDLARASELVEKLKGLPHDASRFIGLQARFYMARNQIKRLEAVTGASDNSITPEKMWGLARMSEELGQIDLAEQLLRNLIARVDQPSFRLRLIEFLGRHGKLKDGVDLCDPMWQKTPNPENLVPSILSLFATPAGKHEAAQLKRVADWFEEALKKQPNSSNLIIGLGNLRELQGRYDEAEVLYRRGIAQGIGNDIALNNLAWLMALQRKNLPEALDLINRVIDEEVPIPICLIPGAAFISLLGTAKTQSRTSRRPLPKIQRARSISIWRRPISRLATKRLPPGA